MGQKIVFVLLVVCSQFFVEFFAWRSVNSSFAAGNYSMHNFYVEVLNFLKVSADLVWPVLNNTLLVSTGLSTAGLGLGLGLGQPGLDNITAACCSNACITPWLMTHVNLRHYMHAWLYIQT
jgi:hypothetical protein